MAFSSEFEIISEEQGWSLNTQLHILLCYIKNEADAEHFENYIQEQAEKEKELSWDEEE